jgi:HK97 family phage prohead protease
MATRPKPGELEERQAPLEADGKRIRGVIPYGTASADLGGFTEIIERGALNRAKLDDLVCVVDHQGVPIGRHPTTLEIEDRADGLHWAVDPPKSREDIREAVERGDLCGGSWRMVVAKDEWRGDVRHVLEIEQLKDVSVVTRPAYRDAVVELRSAEQANNTATGSEQGTVEDQIENEVRSEEPTEVARSAGSLRVEERAEVAPFQTLTEAFRSRGFPAEVAAVSFDEYRAVTFNGGTVTHLNTLDVAGVPFGADRRYARQAVPQQAVTAGVTSVDVFQQTARTLAAGTAVVRNIDATSAKPETSSTLAITNVPLKQVASIHKDVPNVFLERAELATVVETDPRLAINDGLDKLVIDGLATSGFQAPGSDELLVSIRK